MGYLPLIDCHLHMGGCISVDFVWDVIQKKGLHYLAETKEDVYAQMTFVGAEKRNFHTFLDKFRVLDSLPWTEQLIDDSVHSICQYLRDNHVDYAWLDFSINKYMKLGWHKYEAIQFIYDSFQRHGYGRVGLILSLKYESTRASQRQYAQLIHDERAAKCLIGIDLVGDEFYFNTDFYQPIFNDWHNAGKLCRGHFGESQPSSNVTAAIEKLKITNIAHGIKAATDKEVIAAVKDRGITFDLAITSNYITGVWDDINHHPIIDLLDAGVKTTIGSDDPVQCSVSLASEYETIKKFDKITDQHIKQLKQTAYDNSRKFIRAGYPIL